jgi:hypothetical protein
MAIFFSLLKLCRCSPTCETFRHESNHLDKVFSGFAATKYNTLLRCIICPQSSPRRTLVYQHLLRHGLVDHSISYHHNLQVDPTNAVNPTLNVHMSLPPQLQKKGRTMLTTSRPRSKYSNGLSKKRYAGSLANKFGV